MITYDVLLLTLSGGLIGHGIYQVPVGQLIWTIGQPCALCSLPLQVMLEPPEKFLHFQREMGRRIGPGALGFPNGIIPCDKYLVEESGIRYVVCAYKNVIVYEYYLKDFGVQVSLRPTLEALKLVPFVTDPASPTAKAVLSFISSLIVVFAIVSFLKRHELVVV